MLCYPLYGKDAMRQALKEKIPVIIILLLMLATMPLVVRQTFQTQDIRNRAQEEKGLAPIAPYVSIVSPTHEGKVQGTTDVTVEIINDAAVSGVEFYVDNTLQTTVKTQPFSYSWNVEKEVSGMHTITVRAYDRNLNVGTKSITVFRD